MARDAKMYVWESETICLGCGLWHYVIRWNESGVEKEVSFVQPYLDGIAELDYARKVWAEENT